MLWCRVLVSSAPGEVPSPVGEEPDPAGSGRKRDSSGLCGLGVGCAGLVGLLGKESRPGQAAW